MILRDEIKTIKNKVFPFSLKKRIKSCFFLKKRVFLNPGCGSLSSINTRKILAQPKLFVYQVLDLTNSQFVILGPNRGHALI